MFKAFLSSLAPISRTHYQIWGSNGEMVFSTDGVRPKERSAKECHNLSNLVMDQNAFQYSVYDVHNFLCGIPLRNGQGVFGALVAFGQNPDTSSEHATGDDAEAHHAAHMERLLRDAIGLVEKKFRVEEELEEIAQELEDSYEDLYLYARLATQIESLEFSSDMLRNLTEKLLDNMRADAAFAFLPDREQYNIEVINPQTSHKFSGQDNFFQKLIHMIPPDTPTLKEKFFILNDSRENLQFRDLAADPYRFLAVKVKNDAGFYGWLGLVSFNLKEIFRRGELRLLISMAEQLAVLINNTDLYQDLQHFIIKMVKSLVFAIEAKDVYTRGHSERVSKYSILIGGRLDLDDKERNDLKWASILHDIGKIGIPESILNKPGSLTDAEYEVIKNHPGKGGEILKPVDQLADSMPGIIHHHERYDGRGYPQGLKGEEIPLTARIIAVADTFDAINSHRAYRRAKSPEKALAVIEEVAGSQLDPRIVDVFKKVYKEDLMLEKEEKSCQTH
jgi:HD-GYP domain-containing protein (c-di-GMP phosphodiesterase class II)